MNNAPPRSDGINLPILDTSPGYKRVAALIEGEIVRGRIQPGEILPTEIELAAQLQVHRSTVREGIRALENSGLIKRVGGKRLVVSVPELSTIARYNVRAMALRKVSFLDLWEVQMQIEPFCAALAAQRINSETADLLCSNVQRLERDLDDDDEVMANDVEFHRVVARAAGNNVLELSTDPISALLLPATINLYKRVPAARHRLLVAHKNIAAAIVSHDDMSAREWMAKHIRDFRRAYSIAGMDLAAPITFDEYVPRP